MLEKSARAHKKPHQGAVPRWGSCIFKAIEHALNAGWKTQTVIVLTSKTQ